MRTLKTQGKLKELPVSDDLAKIIGATPQKDRWKTNWQYGTLH